MKSQLPRYLALLALVVTSGALVQACAPADGAQTQHPLTEAYLLMDQGENAKAIMLLEQVSASQPDDEEARFLLATAYAGQAGINIFSLHDSFRDILFSRSLKDNFISSEPAEAEQPQLPATHAPESAAQTVGERMIDRLDSTLNQVRQAVFFLNRFPEVSREKWPLLDRSLEILDSFEGSRFASARSDRRNKDIALYRLFMRMVYIKGYITEHLIHDSNFGTRRWVCSINFSDFVESIEWVTRQLVQASSDFARVYPNEASNLDHIHGVLAGFLSELDQSQNEGIPGTETTLLAVQGRFRAALHCSNPRAGGTQ